jgi:glutathione synthase/RimK-type ligase-like ATP-grasp enzyme
LSSPRTPARHRKGTHAPRSRNAERRVAIVVDPAEHLPPSDERALDRFDVSFRRLGLVSQTIRCNDFRRVETVDAVFIRATTAIGSDTHELACYARALDVPVIDDPESIEICCDKRAVLKRLRLRRVPHPPTVEGDEANIAEVAATTGFPCVLKTPESCASRGVLLASSRADVVDAYRALRPNGGPVLLQPFLPTPFDWRIGVLDRRPFYACRYHVVLGDWRVIRWADARVASFGTVEARSLRDVPIPVLRAALDAAAAVGNGLYGVDVKWIDGRPLVIDVNDNPTINATCEDACEGQRLYDRVAHAIGARIALRAKQRIVLRRAAAGKA